MNTLKITFEASELENGKIDIISEVDVACKGYFLAAVYTQMFNEMEKQAPKIFKVAMEEFLKTRMEERKGKK